MWKIAALAGCALMFGLSGAAQAATANVTFVDPEHFTGGIQYGDEQKDLLAKRDEIARHIQQLAARKLPANQTLDVDVLEVRLVGSDQRWPEALTSPPLKTATMPFGNSLRQTSLATWPSITLRYQLKQGDQVLAKGEESISDRAYLDHLNAYSPDDPLRFEKTLLDHWVQQRLVRHEPR